MEDGTIAAAGDRSKDGLVKLVRWSGLAGQAPVGLCAWMREPGTEPFAPVRSQTVPNEFLKFRIAHIKEDAVVPKHVLQVLLTNFKAAEFAYRIFRLSFPGLIAGAFRPRNNPRDRDHLGFRQGLLGQYLFENWLRDLR